MRLCVIYRCHQSRTLIVTGDRKNMIATGGNRQVESKIIQSDCSKIALVKNSFDPVLSALAQRNGVTMLCLVYYEAFRPSLWQPCYTFGIVSRSTTCQDALHHGVSSFPFLHTNCTIGAVYIVVNHY
jgi:hypothetical protein